MEKGLSYEEAMEFLYCRLPMFSHIGPAAYRANLDNIISLCSWLGNPQARIRTVHIAGTNGKGSVSHMLSACFQQAGYRTGLYTSPHLKDFRERIRIGGVMVERSFVQEFVDRVRGIAQQIQPSFFEITVAMAFAYFVEKKVEMAIIETGLGGRLDSTNIIVPDLSVITNISFDHQNILGDSLTAIAGEKAGIIKRAVPVVVGEFQPGIASIFLERAGELDAPLLFADRKFQVISTRDHGNHLAVSVKREPGSGIDSYELDLHAQYQAKNLLTALAALDVLRQKGWNLPEDSNRSGLSRVMALTGLRGRWEQVESGPAVILDVGHNEAGVLEIRKQLACTPYDRLRIVLGTVRDKDTQKMLASLPPEADYYFCQASIPRALDHHLLAGLAHSLGLRGEASGTPAQALEAARRDSGPGDLILVCGSCFVVGELI